MAIQLRETCITSDGSLAWPVGLIRFASGRVLRKASRRFVSGEAGLSNNPMGVAQQPVAAQVRRGKCRDVSSPDCGSLQQHGALALSERWTYCK